MRCLNTSLTRAMNRTADGAGGEGYARTGREGNQIPLGGKSEGRTTEMLIECTAYGRPTLYATTTSMAQADISYTLHAEVRAGRSRYTHAVVRAGLA